MAPLKFEESIKNKLEKRTIQPSKGSWDKLADQLDGENDEKSSLKYSWLLIAASIIGVAILTSIFIKSGRINKFEQHQIVNIEKGIDEVLDNNEIVDIDKKLVIPDVIKVLEVSEQHTVNKTIVGDDVFSKSIIKQNTSNQVATIITKVKNEDAYLKDEKTITTQENTLVVSNVEEQKVEENQFSIGTDVIQEKLNQVLAQVQELEKGKENVTDDEINALLYEAQKEILSQQLINSNTVNASALLLDVELELDESFKQRVFETLKTGFKKIKTSVAERDN